MFMCTSSSRVFQRNLPASISRRILSSPARMASRSFLGDEADVREHGRVGLAALNVKRRRGAGRTTPTR